MEVRDKIGDSLEHIGAYVQNRLDLVVLNASDKVANTAATVAVLVIAWTLSGFVFTFLGLGLAWWIGQEINNMPAGFFIVAGVFVLLTLIAYGVAKKIIRPSLLNSLINKTSHDRKN